MTTAAVGVQRNRIVSRLSHLRDKESRKREESVEIKFELDNLPSVDRGRSTVQQKKRIHQIILDKPIRDKPEETSLYDVDSKHFTNKFHQTITSWRKPAVSFRASTNKPHDKKA